MTYHNGRILHHICSEGPRNNFYKLSNFYQNFIQVRNGEKKLDRGGGTGEAGEASASPDFRG